MIINIGDDQVKYVPFDVSKLINNLRMQSHQEVAKAVGIKRRSQLILGKFEGH